MICKIVLAAEIAAPFRSEVQRQIGQGKPRLVSFLANDDPFAVKYAESTCKTFVADGIDFEVVRCDRNELEERIVQANDDDSIHGVMIYYPVFGNEQDQYLQSVVDAAKDVEGLCHTYKFNMYHNVRNLKNGNKCIIPCTPLAIVKVLEHLSVYNSKLEYGHRLYGKVITVINRSEVVGRPLAALLANDGAVVYSVDINDIVQFGRGEGLKLKKHDVFPCSKSLDEVLALSDVVITGVPSKTYKVDTSKLKDGVVAVNFSSNNNFNPDITEKASLYVKSVGKVTVAMLQRNLLRLYLQQKGSQ